VNVWLFWVSPTASVRSQWLRSRNNRPVSRLSMSESGSEAKWLIGFRDKFICFRSLGLFLDLT